MIKIAELLGYIVGILICLAVAVIAFALFWKLLAVILGAYTATGLTMMAGIGILVGSIIYTVESL